MLISPIMAVSWACFYSFRWIEAGRCSVIRSDHHAYLLMTNEKP